MTEGSLNSNSEIKQDSILDGNQIRFDELFDRLLRRKKIFILISGLVFTISFINLIYRRAVNPLYQGSFTIMISDPIIDKNRGNDIGSIENLAMNRERSDIPTLIQYLKSTKVLEKVAIKNEISPINLSSRIIISIPRNTGNTARFLPKTIRISLNGKNKKEIKNILNDLSKTYLQIAFERKSKNLLEGISFLNNEEPRLIKKSNAIQKELEEFRLKNQLISPVKEGEVLTSAIELIEDKVLSLESENLRLLFIKENLVNGILYTPGINSFKNSDASSSLGVIGSDQLLLKEILAVKSELAKAQSTYKKSSIIVKSLNAKLNQLEPILLKNQKSAVEAAIVINKSLIKSSQNKLTQLNKKFALLPRKINEYSSIMQGKKIIDDNLASLLTAREKLQLELSQGTLPWNIIVEPFVNPKPYKPDVKEHIIYTIIGTLSLATLITLLIDKLDNVFHNPTETEKELKLPMLGFVPYFNFKNEKENNNIEDQQEISIQDFINKNNQEALKNINFIFQETFRNIYTSIKFSISDKEIKTICFTSTVPQEGKSLCSLFLAMNVLSFFSLIL